MGDLITVEPAAPQVLHRGRGRPTVYSEAIAADICQKVQDGATLEAACGSNGITRETFYAWKETRPDFSDAVTRAYAEAELYFTSVIRNATTKSVGEIEYKAAVEWLKRQRRASWGDTLDIRKIDTETLQQYLQTASGAAITEDGSPALLPGDTDI